VRSEVFFLENFRKFQTEKPKVFYFPSTKKSISSFYLVKLLLNDPIFMFHEISGLTHPHHHMPDIRV